MSFCPWKDVVPGVIVAYRISDEDANVWARLFDVGICLEVLDRDEGNGCDVRYFWL